MHGYLKCYYGYKNFGDELLFFGVLDWIKNNTDVTDITIEVGDKKRMTERCQRHKKILKDIGGQYTLYEPTARSKRPAASIYFFGGGEVINDQDTYVLPSSPSLKDHVFHFLSTRRTRSGWNYFIQYFVPIQQGKFYLLGGIGKPYKYFTKLLYRVLLSKAKGIITRDATSYFIAKKYNAHTEQYHDFSEYVIQKHKKSHTKTKHSSTKSYVLINCQSHNRSEKTQHAIQKFCAIHDHAVPIYFPCDMIDDSIYYKILQKDIPSLQLYDRTKYSLDETLGLFINAQAGIGSRLHFLYPLHCFERPYVSTATKDKVRKLLDQQSADAI